MKHLMDGRYCLEVVKPVIVSFQRDLYLPERIFSDSSSELGNFHIYVDFHRNFDSRTRYPVKLILGAN